MHLHILTDKVKHMGSKIISIIDIRSTVTDFPQYTLIFNINLKK